MQITVNQVAMELGSLLISAVAESPSDVMLAALHRSKASVAVENDIQTCWAIKALGNGIRAIMSNTYLSLHTMIPQIRAIHIPQSSGEFIRGVCTSESPEDETHGSKGIYLFFKWVNGKRMIVIVISFLGHIQVASSLEKCMET
jgi:hypothetical protein